MINPTDDVSFYYLRDFVSVRSSYNVTISYTRISDDVVAFGASFCASHDSFNKKLGRKIARGRMENNPHFVSSPKGNRHHTHNTIVDFLKDGYVMYVPNSFRRK